MTDRARLSHAIALASLFGLLALVFAWVVWFLPPQHWPRPLLLLAGVLPLALPLRGMLHGRQRSHLWAAFLSLPYALHGASELWVGGRLPWLPGMELLLALTLFFSSALYLRHTGGIFPRSR